MAARPRAMFCSKPGEMSLHHVRLIHGSDPNPSANAASALRSATFQPMSGKWSERATAQRSFAASIGSAISSRSMRQTHDLSDAAVAFHAHVMGDQQKVLMKNAQAGAMR